MSLKSLRIDRVYQGVKRHVLTAKVLPGDHIDIGALSYELATSITPVRNALHRLVGEGLVDSLANEGFFVPRLTELGLRHLYDWNEIVLLCCLRYLPPAHAPHLVLSLSESEDRQDLHLATNAFFIAIANSTENPNIVRVVKHLNDRFYPVRSLKTGHLQDADYELANLIEAWNQTNLKGLKTGLQAYHQRRRKLVPVLVSQLTR